MARSSGLWSLIFAAVAFVIFLTIVKNPNFKTWLNSIIKQQPAAPQQPPPPGGQQPPPPGGGQVVTGAQIYPSAADPHEYTTTTDGELEQDGDRKEPQLASGFNYLNTEATIYINYHGVNDTLSIKLRGPKHSGIPDADMCNNIHYINLGSGGNQAFGKQWGHTEVYCEFGGSQVSIPENVWVGVKAIEWNEDSGLHFQTWIENPEGAGWTLAADAVDSGSAGDCSGGAANPYTTSPCASDSVSIGFRVDGLSGGGDVEFKGASVREIAVPSAPLTTAPAGGGGTQPEEEEEDTTANIARVYRVSNLI